MSGGLLQLVAYGAQDIYLTGSPQITFFKVVYRRHTNFAMESIEQTFNGAADWGKKVTCTISRNGDLIYRMYFVVTIPKVSVQSGTAFRWLDWLGHILVSSVEVEIGGQRIDKHYGDWLHIWNELTQTAGHLTGYANMVGQTPALTNVGLIPPELPDYNTAAAWVFKPIGTDQKAFSFSNPDASGFSNAEAVFKPTTLYIPLQFWFNRNAGLALPLIALQYHEVKINLEIAPLSSTYWAADIIPNGGTKAGEAKKYEIVTNLSAVVPDRLQYASLFVDYIYLDTDERRRFAQVSHEYLIEQLQFTGEESVNSQNNKIKLNFNHPTKELVWVVQRDDFFDDSLPGGKQQFNYSDEVDTTAIAPLANLFPIADDNLLLEGPNGENLISRNLWNSPYSNAGPGAYSDPDALRAVLAWSSDADNFWRPANWTSNALPAGYNWDVVKSGGVPGVASGGANRAWIPSSFDAGENPVQFARLQLNGHERMDQRDGRYFNLVQPYQHHENVPSMGINVYSFALKPEEHQPTGTCNMSRIDNATLVLQLTAATVKGSSGSRNARVRVYAVNYNVLRIMSGMGGLAYSN